MIKEYGEEEAENLYDGAYELFLCTIGNEFVRYLNGNFFIGGQIESAEDEEGKRRIENVLFIISGFYEFDLSKDSKGFITLKTSQEITNKLAAWCISWRDMVEIVKPAKLKNYIREMRTSFSKINK